MMMTPSAGIAGHTITETLGLVRGNTIRARHVGKDIVASLRTIVGGEIREYTKMLAESGAGNRSHARGGPGSRRRCNSERAVRDVIRHGFGR